MFGLSSVRSAAFICRGNNAFSLLCVLRVDLRHLIVPLLASYVMCVRVCKIFPQLRTVVWLSRSYNDATKSRRKQQYG